MQHTRVNGTSLFRQRNRQGTNNYSNVFQWLAGMAYVQSLQLLDYPALVETRLQVQQEREWFCTSFRLPFLPDMWSFKQCALKKSCCSTACSHGNSHFLQSSGGSSGGEDCYQCGFMAPSVLDDELIYYYVSSTLLILLLFLYHYQRFWRILKRCCSVVSSGGL